MDITRRANLTWLQKFRGECSSKKHPVPLAGLDLARFTFELDQYAIEAQRPGRFHYCERQCPTVEISFASSFPFRRVRAAAIRRSLVGGINPSAFARMYPFFRAGRA